MFYYIQKMIKLEEKTCFQQSNRFSVQSITRTERTQLTWGGSFTLSSICRFMVQRAEAAATRRAGENISIHGCLDAKGGAEHIDREYPGG